MTETRGERRRWLAWLAGGCVALVLMLVVLWMQRAPIAENFIARELNKLGARARYDLVSVGLRTQRIEHLVLGDPANPDVTADWVEIDLAFAGISPSVAALRAGGVRMRGRYQQGRLTLGELDKFRDMQSKAPFSLPDLKVRLTDARMRLDTEFGAVGLKLDGGGNLRSGFSGKLAAVMPRLTAAGCTGEQVTAYVDVATRDARPQIGGPLRALRLHCPGTARVARADMMVELSLGAKLDTWRGSVDGRADSAGTEVAALMRPSVKARFAGNSLRTEGNAALAADRLTGGQGSARSLTVDGRFALTAATVEAEGALSARDLRPAQADPLAGLRRSTATTPLAPLAAKFSDAVRAAGRSNRFATRFSFRRDGGRGTVRLSAAELASASGAHIGLGAGSLLSIAWPGGLPKLDGRLTMAGGGLPTAALALRGSGSSWSGELFLDDYRAGASRLAARELRFVATARGNTRFAGIVGLDGPLSEGFVRGLTVPLSGTIGSGGRLELNPDCAPVSFAQLSLSGLRLGATRLNLCPSDGHALLTWDGRAVAGGAEVREMRLAGTIGSSPLALNADRARFLMTSSGFSASGLQARIGQPTSPVVLNFAEFEGVIRGADLSGGLSGGSGRIGTVPLLMSDANGRWSYAKGQLRVETGLAVEDRAASPRFNRLTATDVLLILAGRTIRATGTLDEPETGTAVAGVTITHDLDSGVGKAELRVEDLTFRQDAVQPDRLTPLARGVVANVDGKISGVGHIRWTAEGVSSDGQFSTPGTNLAAAFGPVEGLSGEIRFSDLLGLVTPPHQEMTIASINPGVPVTNGKVLYQLLPGQKVRIEQGIWPFSGGRLVLEPTMLDLATQSPRNLTFQVEGLDAAQFLQELDFKNINATGVFDGRLPMVFDAEGGRIVGGKLVARAGGGNIAYVGELTQEDLGYWGNYAFQMLKSLNYRTLTVDMNGNVGGEIITQIAITGLTQGEGANANFISRRIARLPIRFNVTVRAAFRDLLAQTRSFYDPTVLRADFAEAARKHAAEDRAKSVQQQESETKP